MSNQKKPKKSKGTGSGIIAFGVVFALFSVLFRPHSVGAFLLALALSVFAGAIIRVMASGLDLSTKEKTPDSLKKVEGTTGNADVDSLLEKGREMILEIRAENQKIPDAGLSDMLDQLENQCAEIFRAVYDKPAKASQIRKFMDYYLPTTLKMVKSYRVLGERNVSGTDVQSARKRISDALGVVLTGCQKMLDNLYRDDVLDITTDIDVLEQMLKRDGLTESELQKAAEQAKEAARIDAETHRVQQARAAQAAAQAAPVAQATPAAQPTAQTTPAAPQWQTDSGVKREVQDATLQAQSHMPQVPTIHGELFPTYGGDSATAQQKQE